MDSTHLDQDEFLARLGELFSHRQGSDHGAIYLTQKRSDPFADLKPSGPLPVIVRASNGKSKKERSEKVKLSTIVQPDDLEKFYVRYAEVCKAGMTALKPRDRSKKKAKAKKKKATTS
ncbi:hypothetical protein DCS_01840 [Drechmeria coniospora]|uniref:Signal recognition particle subunit SRP14 n=1 Tax=Drechmeria coniospora TaxID=98403 RepID=A0A151GUK6_DRECN|nr:hypothetical protein DCS_01840 [Drechmeria coniospora]KYK60702.1 hypothetical protein DCS_01840 [Drechmeria coniospora]